MLVGKPQRQGLKEPIAGSAGAFPSLSQLGVAPRQSTPATAATGTHERQGLGPVVAAVYASDGGRLDGSCLEPQRSIVFPGAAVASAADGLKPNTG